MNFKLKNIEDLKGEIDIYILQTNILINLDNGNNYPLSFKELVLEIYILYLNTHIYNI